MSYHYDSMAAKQPNMLTRIRQLARQDHTREEIRAKLLEEGFSISKSVIYRTIREYRIPIRHAGNARVNGART